MAKISLCMIVKDDAKEAIKSVYKYVDEIVLVGDEKALQPNLENTEVGKVRIYDYKWRDDFAHARNFSFSKASHNVVLWIDADDKVIGAENLPKLAQLIEDGKADWIELEYIYEKDELGRVVMRHWKPRLMRKGSGVWKKTVHEVFEATNEVVRIRDSSVIIDHQSQDSRARSGERNLKILLKEYNKDQESTDPRTLYYIGNTLMAMEKFEEAVPFYAMHVDKCGWPEEKYFSLHYLSHCLSWAGQTDKAINMALEATKIFPNWSLAYFDLGEYYSIKKEPRRAIEWLLTGLEKTKPDPAVYFTNDLDYTIYPLGRLADAYLEIHEFAKAAKLANYLMEVYPKDPQVKELYDTCKEIMKQEKFVTSFINVANTIGDTDRIKAAKLFDSLPSNLEDDIRIQNARQVLVPPKNWEVKSIVIYAHTGLEAWGPPSILTGLGGSEEAIVNMGIQLTKLGYKVTVYNKCGDYAGIYDGVEYKPYFHFNPKDNFDTLIIWRYPAFLNDRLKAKRVYLWLHDIVGPNLFNDRIIANVDKVLFLSKWHRDNLPDLPEEKVFITNNGINPVDFEDEIVKRPNSLVWTSSYDRGLLTLVRDIFPIIKKEIPDVTLDVCYGWDNIEKEMGVFPHLKELREELGVLLKQPGMTHHGRVGHKQVAQLLKSSMVMPYSSEFGETNNISSQKAQAAGCYVITTSQAGATPERLEYGGLLEGNGIYTDSTLQKRFAELVVDYLKNPIKEPLDLQLKRIREKFSWESTARLWQKGLLNG